MNLLLLHQADIEGNRAYVEGRRAIHIIRVLKKQPGDEIRAGVANNGTCTATVIGATSERVELALSPIHPVEAPSVHVILALPRPKALSRIISAASSFGIASLTLINAWRVEKSYFESPRLTNERMLADAILGCEQGAQVWLPQLSLELKFRRYIEDLDSAFLPRGTTTRVVLHPSATATLGSVIQARASQAPEPLLLALGPEGGFIDAELQSFDRAGYTAAGLQTGPLRTEVALAAALGQIALVRPSLG